MKQKGLASLSDIERTLTALWFRPFTNTVAPIQASHIPLMLYHPTNIGKICQLTLTPRSRWAVLDNLTHPGHKSFGVRLPKSYMSDWEMESYSTMQTSEDTHTYKPFLFYISLTHTYTLTLADFTVWPPTQSSRIVKVLIPPKCAERCMPNRKFWTLWKSVFPSASFISQRTSCLNASSWH